MEPTAHTTAATSDGAVRQPDSIGVPQQHEAQQNRSALIRSALRTLVARDGFHGASMSAVAKEAGVASGTAYVYYKSKDELVISAYKEAKFTLADVCIDGFDSESVIDERFIALWLNVYHYLGARPDEANFLLQVEASPYAQSARDAVHLDENYKLLGLANHPELASRLIPLPLTFLWVVGVVPAIWLAAQHPGSEPMDEQGLRSAALGCWRAITVD